MRPLLKLTLLLTLIFAACIGLIRAQPYDDAELRAFLTPPDGCPMPCFMGIRPGVTTMAEAVAILQSNSWVAGVQFHSLSSDTLVVTWRWDDSLSFPGDNSRVNELRTSQRVVEVIILPTRLRFGELWLSFENPDEGYFLYWVARNVPPPYQIHYILQDIRVITSVNCANFWEGSGIVVLGSYEVESAISVHGIEAARMIACWLPFF